MKMKKILISIFAAFFAATALFAQSTEEILYKMDQKTKRFDSEGFYMIMEIKLPIIGTMGTDVYMNGDKYKLVTDVKGESTMFWSDGNTDWEYDASKKEIVITNSDKSDESQAESNVELLKGVTDGYDVVLKKVTDEAWYFVCNKSKTNKDKDDPKKMDLVVSKATYLPISLKSTMKGVTVTLRNFKVGISEEEVTFTPKDYPNAKIIDKR